MNSLWDWGFLDSVCSGVGDVDGILEHCGEILFLEGKPMGSAPAVGQIWPTLNTKGGQPGLWRGLVGRGITVLVLWGDALDSNKPRIKVPQRRMLWRRFQLEPDSIKAATIESVKHLVERWWLWAEKGTNGDNND